MFLPKAIDNQHLQFTSGVADITAIERSAGYVYNAPGRPLLGSLTVAGICRRARLGKPSTIVSSYKTLILNNGLAFLDARG